MNINLVNVCESGACPRGMLGSEGKAHGLGQHPFICPGERSGRSQVQRVCRLLAVLPPLEGTPTVRSPPSSAKRGAPRGARRATDFPIHWWAVFIPAGGSLGESGPEPVTS